MKPEYAKHEVYDLIASWAESCGFEIRYNERDPKDNRLAHPSIWRVRSMRVAVIF